ncbi:MAG TPA: hypothetical protein VN896_02735 [Methylomirabilota bacterium]|jgi:hypothetical protein|nr:hypothetical protein [Methylomirabilota bacterium]
MSRSGNRGETRERAQAHERPRAKPADYTVERGATPEHGDPFAVFHRKPGR